jgi:hypothetical protein
MAVESQITVAEWIEARDVLVGIIKVVTPQSRTQIQVAEALMEKGFVDVDAVLAGPRKLKAEREAALAKRQQEEAARQAAQQAVQTKQRSTTNG